MQYMPKAKGSSMSQRKGCAPRAGAAEVIGKGNRGYNGSSVSKGYRSIKGAGMLRYYAKGMKE